MEMRIYPSLTEEFNSPLLPSELLARVQQNTNNRVFEFRDEPFRGEVGATSFSIQRIRWYNNVSNRPKVTGSVKALPNSKGSKLILRHYIRPFGFWFSTAVVFIICSFGMLIAVGLVLDRDAGPISLLLPPSLFFLALFSITGPFWQAVKSSRELLIKLSSLEKQETRQPETKQ
jgi:hypothetical protein